MVGDILQPTHLIFVLVVALLVLGPKRLPEVARTLGNGLRDFRSAISGESRDDDHDDDDDHHDRRTIAAVDEDEDEDDLDHMRIYSERAEDEPETAHAEETAEAVAPVAAGDEHKQPAAQADKPA